MELKEININNFRNYQHQVFMPGKGINVIYGNNGEGKTNLLESVYYLFSAVSHRTKKDRNLIKEEEIFFRLKGNSLFDEGNNYKLDISYDLGRKKNIMINGNKVSIEKYFSGFPVVIFHPRDIYLTAEGPGERRSFLNAALIRHNPVYYYNLINYYRVIRQRNAVLKKGYVKKEDITLWDTMLAEHGCKVISERIIHIDKLSDFADYYQKLFTGGEENLRIFYKNSINMDIKDYMDIISNKLKLEEIIYNFFIEALNRKREEEIKRGYTVCGPHVDDMRFALKGREIKNYSSQGQQRTTVISLKMAEAELLNTEKSERPLLLLDDCLSELDEKRSRTMLAIINEKKFQCIITTYEKIYHSSSDNILYFKVSGGNLSDG